MRTQIIFKSMLGCLVLGHATPGQAIVAHSSSLSMQMYQQRVDNAAELLGSHYKKSVVRTTESIAKINGSIYRWTKTSLPQAYKKDYQKIAQAIIDEAYKNEFDPVLLMAVIQSESSFIPTRLGNFGEIGLMQIKPSTAKWIAKKEGLSWKGPQTLLNPISNVQLGAAYLHYLRGRFDSHARLYLAAYNQGGANVRGALDRNIWPKDYPIQVMKKYVAYYTDLRDHQKEIKLD